MFIKRSRVWHKIIKIKAKLEASGGSLHGGALHLKIETVRFKIFMRQNKVTTVTNILCRVVVETIITQRSFVSVYSLLAWNTEIKKVSHPL